MTSKDDNHNLEARVDGLEKIVGVATKKTEPTVVPLHLCNQRYLQTEKELRAERNEALEAAKNALEATFNGGPYRGNRAPRARKNLVAGAIDTQISGSKKSD